MSFLFSQEDLIINDEPISNRGRGRGRGRGLNQRRGQNRGGNSNRGTGRARNREMQNPNARQDGNGVRSGTEESEEDDFAHFVPPPQELTDEDRNKLNLLPAFYSLGVSVCFST